MKENQWNLQQKLERVTLVVCLATNKLVFCLFPLFVLALIQNLNKLVSLAFLK